MMGRVLLAFMLGAAIGFEREAFQKPAGLRTHVLVAIGAAAFTEASIFGFTAEMRDPARLAANIVVGIGFLGAGTIWRSGSTVIGLTTAASLWVVAAIGVLAGAGLGWLALFTTLLAWVVSGSSAWPASCAFRSRWSGCSAAPRKKRTLSPGKADPRLPSRPVRVPSVGSGPAGPLLRAALPLSRSPGGTYSKQLALECGVSLRPPLLPAPCFLHAGLHDAAVKAVREGILDRLLVIAAKAFCKDAGQSYVVHSSSPISRGHSSRKAAAKSAVRAGEVFFLCQVQMRA